jgi:PAS domain S-box-containing protein
MAGADGDGARARDQYEERRLERLHRLHILDTPPEPAFDAIAALAGRLFGVRTALVALVDRDRLWFKARVGMEIAELPRSISFCSTTIESDDVLVVEDLSRDRRFAGNPLVTDEAHLRFYAGAPLRTTGGYRIGTVALVGTEPRTLDAEDAHLLARLAKVAVEEIESRVTMSEDSAPPLLSGYPGTHFDVLFDQLPCALWTTDADLVFTMSVGGALGEMGLRPSDVVGRNVMRYAGGSSKDDQTVTAHRRALAGEGVDYTYARGGRDFEVHVEPLRDVEKRIIGTIGVAADVTSRARLERRVQQSERLATLGLLVATVGHEIGNPLTYVAANVSLALKRIESDDPRKDALVQMLSDASEGTQRIAHVLSDLKYFSAARTEEYAPVDAVAAARVALRLASHALRTLTLRLDLTAVPPVLGTEMRLAQVVLHLLVNAAHAASGARGESAEVHLATHAQENRVIIEVTDNGPGIPVATRERLSDAFFATKTETEGTGLGLAIVSGIVTSLSGTIEVESVPDRGTTFRVVLPVAP